MPAGDIHFQGRYRNFTLRLQDLVNLAFYIAIWIILLHAVPINLTDRRVLVGFFIIGFFGLWRYGWWMLNLARSLYYGRVLYPRLRAGADQVWRAGWRPPHVHFLMTTYHEDPWTTCKCLEAINREVGQEGVAATLWIGTGADEDEKVIRDWIEEALYVHMNINVLRQTQPGKRSAIAMLLRALSRQPVHPADLAVLLDGDSIMMPGCLQKCLSLMGAYSSLQALTTDEDAVCVGPLWVQKWLTMRFAQRRMWMQSHAVSRRVLTLTGRFSVFRAPTMIKEEFINIVENDRLIHWFWGSFRFLSGDDKSTWYYLLWQRADMLFVPDAMVYTIEHVKGNGIKRARDNVIRWSGNMLRNGMRAIALGPKIVPPYIWWCLVDQRLTIVTTLVGFFSAISVILFIQPEFFVTYILWIMLTRLVMSAALFAYSSRIHMSYPLILYINQLVLAFVKAYIIFRLPQQRWANRNDQRSDYPMQTMQNRLFPLYQNVFYITLLGLGLLLFLGVLDWPDLQQFIF